MDNYFVKTSLEIKEILQDDVKKSLVEDAYQGNDANAQFILGYVFENGKHGAPKIYTEAVKLYTLAANQGHAEAQYNLGFMYCYPSNNEPQNCSDAFKWFQKSADQGHAGAQFRLGVLYNSGKCVPQDKIKAIEWYKKSANQGHTLAQLGLGEIYMISPVATSTENNIEALRWLEIGFRGLSELSSSKKTRDYWQERISTVKSLMKNEEIDESMKRAFLFVKQCCYKMFEE